MRVQVIRAWPDRFDVEELQLDAGATVADALGLTTVAQQGVAGYAIHGERASPEAALHDGDRLELLEPLRMDPKEARRRRATAQAEQRPPRS